MAEFYPSKVDVAGSTPVILFCVAKYHVYFREDLYGLGFLEAGIENVCKSLTTLFAPLTQRLECRLYTAKVTGSNPVGCIATLAQRQSSAFVKHRLRVRIQ